MESGQLAICREPGSWDNVPCIIQEIIDCNEVRLAVILSNIRVGPKIVPLDMLDKCEDFS